MSNRCLYCAAEIPAGETIRMVTRYSCGKCWMREDVDRLLADCRGVLEWADDWMIHEVVPERALARLQEKARTLLSRLPER